VTPLAADRLLQQRLTPLVSDEASGRVGVHVVDMRTVHPVFSYEPATPLMMASTAKLFTVAAALELLGPEARVATRFYSRAQPDAAGVLKGDLYLRGAGDPSLGDNTHARIFCDRGTTISALAQALETAGVRRVTGELRVDTSVFDALTRPTGRLAGLMYNAAAPQVHQPPQGQSTTPIETAAAVRDALRTEGMQILGGVRAERVHPRAKLLTEVASPTVADLCTVAGRHSDNLVAEALAKLLDTKRRWGFRLRGGALRRGATTRHGVERLTAHSRRAMQRAPTTRGEEGPARHEYQQVDGSGLGFTNVASPRAVTAILRQTATEHYAPDFFRSLALMGATGTLRHRGRDSAAAGRILAKTGTHLTPRRPGEERRTRSSALSGYCLARPVTAAAVSTAQATQGLAFSVMQQNPRTGDDARALQDAVVEALIDYVDGTGTW
jgi:D-alanyl-D-alanine carboxypeptidase